MKHPLLPLPFVVLLSVSLVAVAAWAQCRCYFRQFPEWWDSSK